MGNCLEQLRRSNQNQLQSVTCTTEENRNEDAMFGFGERQLPNCNRFSNIGNDHEGLRPHSSYNEQRFIQQRPENTQHLQNTNVSTISHGQLQENGSVIISNYSIHLHDNRQKHKHTSNINQPKADAILIGNEGRVNIHKDEPKPKKEKDNSEDIGRNVRTQGLTMELLKSVESNLVISRKTNEKILDFLKRLSFSDSGSSVGCSSHENRPIQKKHKSYIDEDRYLLNRSRSIRKSKRTYDLKLDKTHGLLQTLKWNQYEKAEKSAIQQAKCHVQTCATIPELDERVDNINTNFHHDISLKTKELIAIFEKATVSKRRSKTGNDRNWIENAQRCLMENELSVVRQTEQKVETVRKEREMKILKSAFKSLTNEWGEDTKCGSNAAENFISIFTTKIINHVTSLLSFEIEQDIVVFTFKCQKSYVLRRMMEDFVDGRFRDSMNYILAPNDFAQKWLQSFTNGKIFHQKKKGFHIFAKLAKSKIVPIVQNVRKAFDEANKTSDLKTWKSTFLELIQLSELLPLSDEEINCVFDCHINPCKLKFNAFVNHRLDFLECEILTHFKNVDETNVNWENNPHEEIFKKLWGCSACCPFCNEPCRYTDIDHIVEGYKHQCMQHRPLGVFGFLNNDDLTFVKQNCTSIVQTDDKWYKFLENENVRMCKDYTNEFNSWLIKQNSSKDHIYWAWFITTHSKHLMKLYGASSPCCPEKWNEISPHDAIRSLYDVYTCY